MAIYSLMIHVNADHPWEISLRDLQFSRFCWCSLSLSITVSVIALVAKLWLVNYSHQVFSVGSPYDRAMKRQEAYNGVLEWNLGGVRVVGYSSSNLIGLTIGVLLNVGGIFLGFASLGGVFVSGCLFCSTFSCVIRFFFEKFQTLSKWLMIWISDLLA